MGSEIVDDSFELIYLISALSNLETVMARNPAADHVLDDAQDRLPTRLRKRLIAAAGNLRNFVFENWPVDAHEDDRSQAQDRFVGWLISDGKETQLDLRGACNKLLHAQSIEYAGTTEIGTDKIMDRFNVLDCVVVTGAIKSGKAWTAVVNIPEFATGAYIAAQIAAESSP